MPGAGILLGAILALAAVLIISAAIAAAAPYIAIVIVGVGLLAWYWGSGNHDPPGGDHQITPVKPPRD